MFDFNDKVSAMNKYKKPIRTIIHFIVCIQLILSPAWSFSAEQPTAEQPTAEQSVTEQPSNPISLKDSNLSTELQKAEKFNEEVASLYDHVLGRRVESEYYKNHPLDVYGLIGQEVRPYQYREVGENTVFSKTDSHYINQEKPYYNNRTLIEERIGQYFSRSQESSNENTVESEPVESETTTPENEQKKPITENEKTEPEQEKPITENEKTEPEQEKPNPKPLKPYKHIIPIEHLFVEVVDEKGEVKAILNTKGEKINPLVFKGASSAGWVDSSLYTNHSYITEDEGKYQFRITYRGQVLHTFPNHISWISIFGPYIVLMQASQVYEKGQAMPSFIDLSYFQQALGKTALPLFRAPAKIDTEEKRNTLLTPENIFIENTTNSEHNNQEQALRIKNNNKIYTFTQSEIAHLSQIQQMFYNLVVSLINIKNYDSDVIPFVKDIARQVEQLTEKAADIKGENYIESISILKEILSARLQQRSQIGSPNDRTGAYGQWINTRDRLERNQARLNSKNNSTRATLLENLEKDTAFQTAVSETSQENAKKEGIIRRLQALYWRLTMPQPLGTPKILEGLGLIAGSLRPQENVQTRGGALMEGLKTVFASKSGRIGSTALVAGLLGIASPEIALFYKEIFTFSADLVKVSTETLYSSVSRASAFILEPSTLHSSYVADGKAIKTAEGLGAMLGIVFSLFGLTHIIMNSWDFRKYLKSQKAQTHQEEVRSFRTRFMDWEQRQINEFNENLIKAELRKTGLPVEIHLPGGTILNMVFQTDNSWARLINNYNKNRNHINLNLHINNGATFISLSSSQEILESDVKEQKKIKLILKPSISDDQRQKSRTFVLQEGIFADLFKNMETGELANSIEMELSAQNKRKKSIFHYTGVLSQSDFSKEEQERVKQALEYAQEYKQNRSLLRKIRKALRIARKSETEQTAATAQTETLSQTQINSFAKAVLYSWSFANWNKTFSSLIKVWNSWFKFRTLLMSRPSVSLRVLFFNKHFDRIHEQRIDATIFNGGRISKWRAWREQQQEQKSGKEYLSVLENFEQQVLAIEKQYIRASAEEAYLLALNMYADPKIDESIKKELENILHQGVDRESNFRAGAIQQLGLKIDESTDNFSLHLPKGKLWDRANRKTVFLMEFFQRTLRKEAIRDLLKEKLGLSDQKLSDLEIRKIIINRIQAGDSLDFLSTEESLEEVRNRVKKISERLNLKETVVKSMGKFYKEFFKKWKTYSEINNKQVLDPMIGMSMGRYKVAKDALKDPEALARAVKSQIVETIIDKPLELFLMFMVLAGVDYGLLQLVQEERFSETSFFYTSRFAMWSGFFTGIILSILGESWFKVQQDARLAVQKGFDRVPDKKDLEKKFAGLKWYYLEGFRRPFDNKIGANYKYTWKLNFSNFKAAIPTFVLIYFSTLGRFDVEFFMGAYISALIALSAFHFKIENTFEKSMNYSLRSLIKGGLDLRSKDEKLLSHIDIVRYKLNQSFLDRMKFNVVAHSILNPLGELFNILQTIDTRWGSRGISRILGMGGSFTEYWGKLMDTAEEQGILPEKIANACKKAFTRNRTDILD